MAFLAAFLMLALPEVLFLPTDAVSVPDFESAVRGAEQCNQE